MKPTEYQNEDGTFKSHDLERLFCVFVCYQGIWGTQAYPDFTSWLKDIDAYIEKVHST